MKALVTGFEPFGTDRLNSSLETAMSLPAEVGRYRIVAQVLPVVYGASMRMLKEMIRTERPDCVLCLGLAGGRKSIAVETLARNLKDARIPDNDGNQPRKEPIDPRSPLTLGPLLPVGGILEALSTAGVPAEISRSAGAYLCNYVFYGLVAHLSRVDPSMRAGFIHVPYVAAHRGTHPEAPYLELDTLVRGIETIFKYLSH